VAVPGLMASNVPALTYATRSVLANSAQNEYDPLCLPIPWNEAVDESESCLQNFRKCNYVE